MFWEITNSWCKSLGEYILAPTHFDSYYLEELGEEVEKVQKTCPGSYKGTSAHHRRHTAWPTCLAEDIKIMLMSHLTRIYDLYENKLIAILEHFLFSP